MHTPSSHHSPGVPTTQSSHTGKVWFIGAGPGDPELITVKGQRLIAEADLVLYAGSLVPKTLVACARPDAQVVDSAPLPLEQTHALMLETAYAGGLVARVHTGDPMLYGAVREQAALLERDGIPYEVVPGVTAAFATAAAAKISLTVPETVQSFAITRLDGRTPVPEGQRVTDYARRGGSLAVYLSAHEPERLAEELRQAGLPEETPIVLGYRIGWPDQQTVRTTLAGLETAVAEHGFTRQTVFLVLPGERVEDAPVSRLYDEGFTHGFRDGTKK